MHDLATLEARYDALAAENARLEAEAKFWGDMEVLFQKGGFEAVVAAKDEVIRVLKCRVETESGDKRSWMRSARFWKAEAIKLGCRG